MFKLIKEMDDLILESYKLARQEFSTTADENEVKKYLEIFRNRQDRIRNVEERNINYWRKKGFEKFKEFVISIDKYHISRRARARSVKAASDEILTMKKTDEIHLFFPLSKDASCFYGVRGKDGEGGWCISTIDGRHNHFYDYTDVSNVLFLIYDQEVYALIFTDKGKVLECQDKTNKGDFPVESFLELAGVTMSEILEFTEKHKEILSKTVLDSKERDTPKDPILAYLHAMKTKKRYPEGEVAIATNSVFAFEYALEVLKGRFERGERAISKDPEYALQYASRVLKGRFPEGEPAIANNPRAAAHYAARILKGRFPEGEPAITSEPLASLQYAEDVLKGRFPEGEPVIAKSDSTSFYYAKNVIKGRFPEGEPVIYSNPDYRIMYSRDIEGGGEAMETIAKQKGDS